MQREVQVEKDRDDLVSAPSFNEVPSAEEKRASIYVTRWGTRWHHDHDCTTRLATLLMTEEKVPTEWCGLCVVHLERHIRVWIVLSF